MKNRIILCFALLVSVISFCTVCAYADASIDLGEVKDNIGSVEFVFPEIGADYKVLVSVNGADWDTVAEVENNISLLSREHKFTSRPVRYVKVETQSDSTVSGIKVFRPDAEGLNAAMVYPQAMSYDVGKDIRIEFGKGISSYYVDKAVLTDENGRKIKTSNSIGADGKSVEMKIEESLLPGEYYTAGIKHFNEWGFGINSGASDNIGGQIMSSLAMMPYGTISKSTDGDESTADGVTIEDRGKVFEYDFGRICNNITDIYIKFKAIPTLIEIQTSKDGKEWDINSKHYTLGQDNITASFEPFSARYIRVYGVEGDMSVYEFRADTKVDKVPLEAKLEKCGTDGEIIVRFSHEIMSETIKKTTVRLYEGNDLVPCNVVVEKDNKTISITSEQGLAQSKEHTLVIDGVKDSAGRKIKDTNLSSLSEKQTALEILTVSDSEYFSAGENAIYPVFADNLEYESWNEKGREKGYGIKAKGGCKPYTFELSGGSLPQGLKLSSDREKYQEQQKMREHHPLR